MITDPANVQIEINLDKQQKAKQYARINRRLMLVDLIISSVYLIAWLVFGWTHELKNLLLRYTSNVWILLAMYVTFFLGLLIIINLPLSYYQGYVLPHKFDLSNQKLAGWVTDQIKGIILGGILGLLIIEIIFAVLRAYPVTWWLWAAVILLIFNVILSNLAPILLMPIFNKFTPLSDEHGELGRRLIELAKKSGTQVRGVYKFDMSKRTKQANAALTGLGNTRRIILGDTLVNDFTEEEIVTIMAHELGHQVNKDIPVGIIFNSIKTLIGLYMANLGLNWGVKLFGFSSVSDVAAFPWIVLVLGLYGLITMPLENGYSRWREKLADAYALELTHSGAAYSSALKRLANQNLADVDPEPWVEWMLYSHPTLKKRINMAEKAMDTKPS